MRFTDLWIALPALPFLAVAVSIGTVDLGPLGHASTSAARSASPCCSRACCGDRSRGSCAGATLALREREFVDAARAIGASNTRIITRHVLPNCLGPIIVNATLVVAEAILVESTLSFLGFGIQPPTPSWGNLLSDSIGTVQDWWWLTVFPGLAIFLTVLAVNFVGDGLRDAFDPRRRFAREADTMSGAAALSVEGLRVQFAGDGRVVQAVRGVSFWWRAGETVAVVGESGSGKTVTALAVMGLIEPPGMITDGEVRLAGRSLVGLPERQYRELRGRELAMVFQDPMSALNPVQRVGNQIAEALAVHDAARSRRQAGPRCASCSSAWGWFPRHGWRAPTRTSSRVGCGNA